ncbi:hypothetical protein [uncultured Jatrophihabitans sp.]|uniref:hypothetical protein n=1 Tax=uncultured Jatrophihabitans sp. TaxID=1610747 RepID=UPI0035C98960
MDSAWVGPDGRVRLDGFDTVREWSSLADLAANYWRYQRLPNRARATAEMDAWDCVHDLVGEPAWEGAVELIASLLEVATDDDEVGLVAAGPLEELLEPVDQGPRSLMRSKRVVAETSAGRQRLEGCG